MGKGQGQSVAAEQRAHIANGMVATQIQRGQLLADDWLEQKQKKLNNSK
jgi:hypothetical protein